MLSLVWLALASAAASLHDDPEADRLIRQTLSATYNLQFADARATAQSLQQRYPAHPAGFNLYAETYWWEALSDPGNPAIEKAFFAASEVAVKKGEAALKDTAYPKNELNAYLGSALGSYARFQVTQRSAYFSAMRSALRAHRFAEAVFQTDPSYFDVYVGVGAYNYFTGSLPAVIKPFAFLIGARGDKALGIRQLQTAIEKARYAQTEARIILYTAMLEEKRYPEAWSQLKRLYADYPENFVLFVWMTDWFRRQGRNLEGAEHFEQVFTQIKDRLPSVARHALIERAILQNAHNRKEEARSTVARLRSLGGLTPLHQSRVVSLEKEIRSR